MWTAHEPQGLKAGLQQQTIDVVKYRKSTDGLAEKDAVIITLGREVIGKHHVSSATAARALSLFGNQGLVNIVSLMGDYASTAILLNTFDQHVRPTDKPLLPIPVVAQASACGVWLRRERLCSNKNQQAEACATKPKSFRLGVESLDRVSNPAGIFPVRIFRAKFHGQQLLRFVGRLPLSFEFRDARLHGLEVGALDADERCVAHFAVAGNNRARVKLIELIQDGQPVFSARVRIGKDGEKSIDHRIAREENSILLDENKVIAPRMRRPKPKQPHRDSAQIEFCFVIEKDVGRAGLDVLQERFQIRRSFG